MSETRELDKVRNALARIAWLHRTLADPAEEADCMHRIASAALSEARGMSEQGQG